MSPNATNLTCRHEGSSLTVAGEIDFDNGGAVLDCGRVAIEATRNLTVDLSGVSHSNSVGLAILIEWLAVARRSKHKVTFAGVPTGLLQLAEVCQVTELLQPQLA